MPPLTNRSPPLTFPSSAGREDALRAPSGPAAYLMPTMESRAAAHAFAEVKEHGCLPYQARTSGVTRPRYLFEECSTPVPAAPAGRTPASRRLFEGHVPPSPPPLPSYTEVKWTVPWDVSKKKTRRKAAVQGKNTKTSEKQRLPGGAPRKGRAGAVGAKEKARTASVPQPSLPGAPSMPDHVRANAWPSAAAPSGPAAPLLRNTATPQRPAMPTHPIPHASTALHTRPAARGSPTGALAAGPGSVAGPPHVLCLSPGPGILSAFYPSRPAPLEHTRGGTQPATARVAPPQSCVRAGPGAVDPAAEQQDYCAGLFSDDEDGGEH